MSEIFGLPAHPLLVHIPVVLVPLAFFAALASLWSRWRVQFVIMTAAAAVVGGLGALLAAQAGEALDDAIQKKSSTLRQHVSMGDTAKGAAVLFAFFAVVSLCIVLLRSWNTPRVASLAKRFTLPRWVAPAALALTVVSGAFATYTIVDAGHSGAKSVWQDKVPNLGSHGGDDD